jgi:hypothetical protein
VVSFARGIWHMMIIILTCPILRKDPRIDRPMTLGAALHIRGARRVLRRAKSVNSAQLINVVQAEMSLIDAPPKVPPYVDLCRRNSEEILRVSPEITPLASL